MADRWLMAPREVYRVALAVAANPDTVNLGQVGQVQFSLGLTGYRDVPASALNA
jgi:hypothetical protein